MLESPDLVGAFSFSKSYFCGTIPHTMMKFAFLLTALAFLILPVIFQLDKKIFKAGNFKAALVGSIISALIFSTLAIVLHSLSVLVYNANSLLGPIVGGIPLEHFLFNFCFSFAAVSLYEYLNVRFPKNDLQRYSLALSNLLMGLCVAFLFFGYGRWYTLLTFATLLPTLFSIEYLGKLRFMYKAYRAFAVMLIPYFLAMGTLFWNGLLNVSSTELSGMYVAKIPVESIFMALAMFLVSIYIFEFLKSKKAP
jgi:hypothetical protein